MMEYTFTLKYRLPENETDMDALVERLGEAGCTDAIIGIGTPGRLGLEFSREAETAQEAVRSALADVKATVPGAILVEAGPDLVGLSDIAEYMGVTRQNMRKLMVAHRDFPLPVHEGSVALWHLADVLAWLEDRKGYELDQSLRETAAATLEVNTVKESSRHSVREVRELELLIA
ncbi:helix-turn-helix transcriptional regulator [Microvirga sp. P5_D2]